MLVSAKYDYACRALLELSLHWPNTEPLPITVIAERQGIPVKYLIQILIDLKNMGLVKSIRGKEGGYILAKAPNNITLKEVIENIEGSLLGITDSAKKGSILLPIWIEVEKALSDVLEKITFEDIANKFRETSLMYQI